jgi:hypothetical protein
VDIQTDQYRYVTLPRYVDTVMALNINRRPGEMLNNWFEYHLGGQGNQDWLPCRSWETFEEEFPTVRDVLYPQKLVAIPDIQSDESVPIRVFGFAEHGKPLQTVNAEGVSVDGIPVTCSINGTYDTAPIFVSRITRITKGPSNGFIKLLGKDKDDANEITLGYWYPDETEPRYRRIKLYTNCSRVRIKYRMRENKLSALTDPIHLKSKTALLAMLSAIELNWQGKFDDAQKMEANAERLLREEQGMRNRNQGVTFDCDESFNLRDRFMPS